VRGVARAEATQSKKEWGGRHSGPTRHRRGGPVGPRVSGGVREGESKSEAAAASALTGGPMPHSAWRRNSTWFESK
jgi:hypothetical protein